MLSSIRLASSSPLSSGTPGSVTESTTTSVGLFRLPSTTICAPSKRRLQTFLEKTLTCFRMTSADTSLVLGTTQMNSVSKRYFKVTFYLFPPHLTEQSPEKREPRRWTAAESKLGSSSLLSEAVKVVQCTLGDSRRESEWVRVKLSGLVGEWQQANSPATIALILLTPAGQFLAAARRWAICAEDAECTLAARNDSVCSLPATGAVVARGTRFCRLVLRCSLSSFYPLTSFAICLSYDTQSLFVY